jgi:hypothetical protein
VSVTRDGEMVLNDGYIQCGSGDRRDFILPCPSDLSSLAEVQVRVLSTETSGANDMPPTCLFIDYTHRVYIRRGASHTAVLINEREGARGSDGPCDFPIGEKCCIGAGVHRLGGVHMAGALGRLGSHT